METFEETRQRHIADARPVVGRLLAQLEWPAERLRAHRTAQLRALVRHAVAHSPWHRGRLAGVDVDSLDEERLADLPPMTKSDLMANWDGIVTDPRLRLADVEAHLADPARGYLPGGASAIASGGSSGQRGVFAYGWQPFATLFAAAVRGVLRGVELPTDPAAPPTAAGVAANHHTHATAALHRTFGTGDGIGLALAVTAPLHEVVAALNAAQAPTLHGYPSALHLLCAEAREGRLRIAPERIVTYSEPLLPEIRSGLEATFGVSVRNVYAASEGVFSTPCDHGSTHLADDIAIFEPVDAAGRPVPPGERSAKLYVTNLFNPTLPLIRQEVSDEVTLLPGRCACGWAATRVADVLGRLDDTFRYGDVVVHPHLFRSQLGRRPEVVAYQVRQTAYGAEVAVRLSGPLDLHALGRDLREDLERVGVASAEVTVQLVGSIDRTIGGKLRRFVPLAAAPVHAGFLG